jgi:hypothetical protein
MRLFPYPKRKKVKKKLISSTIVKDLQVTRASVAVNPLEAYNVSTGNVMTQFNNNVEVSHGDYGFIGGDTLEVAYDFGIKVAGSVVECPMKLYASKVSTLQPPTNITADSSTGWFEFGAGNQATLDLVKLQDGSNYTLNSTINSQISQLMLEIDLTPLANQLYGGSNAALKAALKAITADVWALGSGSNASVLTNGVKITSWINGASWSGNVSENTGGTIQKLTRAYLDNATSQVVVNSSNKIYILIYATYPSDGTIASSVSLDYAKITIGLNRTVDTVASKNVYLPKYWAMVGGFSPQFDSVAGGVNKRVFAFYTDVNNRWIFSRSTSAGYFSLLKVKAGVSTSLTSSANTFSKNQAYRFIVGQNASGMFMFLLKNNGTVEKVTNAEVTQLFGQMPLHTLNQNGSEQGDIFASTFSLYDLQALGKQNGLSDAEADAILRGTSGNKLGVSMKELFDINAVTLHANATRSNGVITLNATGANQWSYVDIPVLANNKYEFICTVNGVNSVTNIQEKYNSITVKDNATIHASSGLKTASVIVGANTNKIRLHFYSTTAGTFTFSDISLKLKQ